MEGIIDRFEGDFAVVEFPNRKMMDIPKSSLTPEAKKGDVIKLVVVTHTRFVGHR
jgi:hypothetical protein